MNPLEELREQLGWMARQCDHDGNYIEPNAEKPWDHCDQTWCMRCEVEKARHLLRLALETGDDA